MRQFCERFLHHLDSDHSHRQADNSALGSKGEGVRHGLRFLRNKAKKPVVEKTGSLSFEALKMAIPIVLKSAFGR
jgi:hypothetical protein